MWHDEMNQGTGGTKKTIKTVGAKPLGGEDISSSAKSHTDFVYHLNLEILIDIHGRVRKCSVTGMRFLHTFPILR